MKFKVHEYFCLMTFAVLLNACKVEEKISTKEVPTAVMTSFQAHYSNILYEEWVTKIEKGKTVYEAVWISGSRTHRTTFDENGKLLKDK